MLQATNVLDDLIQISRLRVSPIGMSSRFPTHHNSLGFFLRLEKLILTPM